jgi:GntR family transcriptional regulator/MocR family aminotransferase
VNSLFELPIDLTGVAKRETSRTLYKQLRSAILEGRLPGGARLPPTRSATPRFGVSRNTVADVYARLLSEGFVVARQGAGTFIADPAPSSPSLPPANTPQQGDQCLNPFWLKPETADSIGFWRDMNTQGLEQSKTAPVDFRPALIDTRLFPFDLFRQSMSRQLRRMENRPPAFKSPQGNQGNHHLRVAISEHIGLTRAVACRATDVLVTSGAQQAFDLLARTLVIPGETTVALEDPGYPPMRVAFAAAGAKTVPVEVDDEGLVVDALPADTKIVCVCPSHQFPLGMSMSIRRRKALLAFARRNGAVIVEDDYDGEFRYAGSPLEALRGSDSTDIVFYVGTFSKCMLPSLRLGFVVAPDWAMPTLTAAKNCMDWHSSIPVQIGVAGFIEDGHLTRHVARMRKVYSDRRTKLIEGLAGPLSQWFSPIDSHYGMHVSAWLEADLDLEVAISRLAAERIVLHSLDRYRLKTTGRAGLVFGFGAADLPSIEKGLGGLASVLQAM